MPVKMRLTRHGRKRYAYYHIVIADSRAPRDGRYIERIGMYNPNTNPATIDLDFDKAYDWLTKGAQPTDTVRAILSYKGVLYKKHLMAGVKRGAFDEEEAQRRLEKWLAEKEAKIQAKKESIEGEVSAKTKKFLEAETKKKEEKAAAIAAKNAELAEEAAGSEEEAASVDTEEKTEEKTDKKKESETSLPADKKKKEVKSKEEKSEVKASNTEAASSEKSEVKASNTEASSSEKSNEDKPADKKASGSKATKDSDVKAGDKKGSAKKDEGDS